ncbi:MAG: Fe-S protein assembly co-chaperone HscB [Holosporaceae bacterium]|jgi:molecular chaperone HscB|nr:Fe-S protein assembly co-chaperone HscB [Holosporaceae bacterium]
MNYYEVFGIPVSYRLDEREVMQIYLDKQRECHPDVDDGSLAAHSSLLNEAYSVLKDPVMRAEHFLTINQMTIAESSLSTNDLMEMLDARERYEKMSLTKEKRDFLRQLQERVSTLLEPLCDLENNLQEFCREFARARFFWAFLDKVSSDVYCRD